MAESALSYEDFSKICRLCLKTNVLKPIFSDPKFQLSLKNITNIKVHPNDKLPQYVCTFCVEKINDVDSFIVSCRINDALLKAALFEEEDKKALEGLKVQGTIDGIKTEHCNEKIVKFEHVEENAKRDIITPKDENLIHVGKKIEESNRKQRKKLFTCSQCDQIFFTLVSFEAHIESHTKENKKHKCNICNKGFSSKRYLEGHIRMHTGDEDFQCDICNKTFPIKISLNRHYLSHTEIKAFKCDQCDAAFNRNTLLERHKKGHDENSEEKRRLTCNECGKYFLFPSHLRRHGAVHDLNQKALMYKARPRPTTPGRFLCSYCGKQFTQVSNLRVHVRIHTGERFTCDICGNSFSTKDSLNTHLLAHRGEKPYPCPYCGKQFRKPNYYKHLLIHKDIRRFKCEVCKKGFIRKDQFDQHLMVHFLKKAG